MKMMWMSLLLASLVACGTHGVRCDDRLQPINQPKPHAVVTAPAPASRP